MLTRKKAIKVILEAQKGTKLAATQAILVYDLKPVPTSPFEERNGSGIYRGPTNTGVLGEHSSSFPFKAEMRSNGSAGMEAGLAILLQACGFKKTSEVYAMHSAPADDKTISIDVWEDGVKKGARGASSNVVFTGETGQRLMCEFDFMGVWQTVIDEALPAYAPSTTLPMKLAGGTFTIGGAVKRISKFSLDMGCKVISLPDVNAVGGIAYYMISDYAPVISFDLEADLVANHDINGLWMAGTTAAVVLAVTDGTDHATFTMPAVQYKEIPEDDREGLQIYDVTGQCVHTASGNDAVTIAVA